MRKNQAIKRDVFPDPVYDSKLITKTINGLMWEGKKNLAQKILYEALEFVKKKTEEEGIEVFQRAIENITPTLELRVRRIGGANFQVPTVVSKERKQALALRWLIASARKRNEKSMVEKLGLEIIDASKKTGIAFKKREDTHKMAEANKAFAHLRY